MKIFKTILGLLFILLIACDSGTITKEAPALESANKTLPLSERVVQMEGAKNFRDLGGYYTISNEH